MARQCFFLRDVGDAEKRICRGGKVPALIIERVAIEMFHPLAVCEAHEEAMEVHPLLMDGGDGIEGVLRSLGRTSDVVTPARSRRRQSVLSCSLTG